MFGNGDDELNNFGAAGLLALHIISYWFVTRKYLVTRLWCDFII